MNTQKNVNQRLAKLYSQDTKQELSSEKIELGIVQDFNRIAGALTRGNQTLNKAAQAFVDDLSEFGKIRIKLDDSFGRAETFADQLEDDLKEIQRIADDVAAKAKELGVEPKDLGLDLEVLKVVDDIEDSISTIRKNSDDAKRIIKAI